MENSKLYRAATLREALENIKREMGEDALVLNHKKVRAGGFLGFGAREVVEVYVSTDAAAAPKRKAAAPRGSAKADAIARFLGDAAEAKAGAPAEEKLPTALAALATRAYAGAAAAGQPAEQKPEPAEPRLAFQAPARPITPPSNANISIIADTPPARGNSVAGELNRLRSEFRELKFSLSMLNRPALQSIGHQERLAEFEGDPEIYDSPYFESYMQLIETGLAPELARRCMQTVVRSAGKSKTVEAALADLLDSQLKFAEDHLPINPGAPGAYSASVFIGPTGVGKTTTIAKLAAHVALGARRRVELITLDTYRIAAVEQLKRYAEVIGAGCHVARSVEELDELKRRYEGKAKVFIDTAGRSPNDLADQLELADYLRESRDILKCLVLQATTHPADAMVAVKKFALFGSDHLVITKLDETTRPGAAVGAAADSSLPLAYICAGQRVPEDIQRANPTTFAARILRATMMAAAAA
jgi:flagellar biosynthesis protein FlhF